ncbi:MAG: glycosyltransferase family 39 protein [Candidatus Hydrothermarchaeales archaeon]
MRKRLAGVLLLALVLSVYSALHFEKQGQEIPYVGYDESVYFSLSRHILDTSPFNYTLRGAPLYFNDHRAWYIERPIFHHPPLFTWLLSFAHLVFGSRLLVGRFLNVAFGVLTIYVTYKMALQVSGDSGVAIASSFFLAISSLHVLLSSLVLMDGLLTLLVSLFVLSTIQLSENGTREKAIKAGLFMGLALLTKYSAILAFPILVIYVVARRISLPHLLITLGVAFVMNSWWLLWNLRVYSTSFITSYGEFWRYPNVVVPTHAYLYFIPVVAPAALLGYIGIIKSIKDKEINSVGLSSMVLTYLVFFTLLPLKEMRFVLPMLPMLIILGCQWLYKIPGRKRKILTAILALISFISTNALVKGGYYWYLPLWHLQDWQQEFLTSII